MRVLIFALLAITATATNYGYYSSSYPSYYGGGYGSSLYGVSYGSGYGSGYGYGSGIGYGSGLGYGSGYGSGITYGVGGGHGHYTTSYKPAVYTTRYTGGRKGAYNAGAYDAGAYDTGAYDAGTYDAGTYDAGTYGAYGTGAYGGSGASYKSGYASGGAPGKISFTLGGTGYQTGSVGGSEYGNTRSSVVSKPYGMYRQRTSSTRQSGAQGFGGGVAPGRISFTQDFSRVTGQSSGLDRSSGISGISTARRTVSPVTVARNEFPAAVVGSTGSSVGSGAYGSRAYDSGAYGSGEVTGVNVQEIAGIGSSGYTDGGVKFVSSPVAPAVQRPSTGSVVGLRTVRKTINQPQTVVFTQDFSKVSRPSVVSAIKPAIRSYEKIGAPIRTVAAPKRPYVNRATYQTGGIRSTGALPQISFTQDFSKVSGQSGIIANKPQIHNFNRISSVRPVQSPARPIIAPKITSGSYGQTGIIRSTGFLGNTGTQPRISFTQDFSRITGQSQQYGNKPRVQSFSRVSSPVAAAPKIRTVAQQPIVHGVDYMEKTDVHGISGGSGHGNIIDSSRGTVGISGVQGSLSGFQPASVSSFDKLSTGGVSGISRQSVGGRYGSGLRRTSQSISGVGPAKISFTQDFSRISGQQTSGIKPVISTRNEIPAFPAVVTSPVAAKPVRRPVADKLVFKAPKQPIVQQPTFTTVYDQSPAQEITGGAVESHFTADKSAYSAEPVNTGFVREHVVDYKQEITDVGSYGDKLSDIVYTPGVETAFDKSSGYGHSGLTSAVSGSGGLGNVVSSYKFTSADRVGDKSNIYVAVPVDSKSEYVHSAGVAPSSGFTEEKASYYEINSGNINSASPSLAGHGQVGYSAVTTPFKSYYSSSYPGYSHVSGESPRFDFAHDKSLLYSYSSPYISSPFSYAYASGKGQYSQVYGKSIA